MKFTPTITVQTPDGAQVVRSIDIDAGETLEVPLTFQNPDGTARDMTGAVVSCNTLSALSCAPAAGGPTVQGNALLVLSADQSAALGAGSKYRLQIVETRAGASPPTTCIGDVVLNVR